MTLLHVSVKPRSHADAILGVDEAGFLLLTVRAIPDKGAANASVVKLVAKHLSIPKSSIQIVRGHTASKKTLRIEGIDAEELSKKLYD